MHCRLPDLRQHLNGLVNFLEKCSLFCFKPGTQQAQQEGRESRGSTHPHHKRCPGYTTAILNRTKWVKRDHSRPKHMVRAPTSPEPTIHLSGFLKLKLSFHSVAQQNVASLNISSFPYRKAGQKHASYRDCMSFKPHKGVTYSILKQNTYLRRYECQVMGEFKALSIYHPTKNSTLQSYAREN